MEKEHLAKNGAEKMEHFPGPQTYAQLMLDSLPIVCSVWSAEGRLIDCNMEALRRFELSKKSEYINHFYELSPEYQPDGSRSAERIRQSVECAFETGFLAFEWEYCTRDGEIIPASITMVRVPWQDGYRVLTYSSDLREIQQANAEIQRHTDLMQVVNTIAVNLMGLASRQFDRVIVEQLGVLGSAIGAERVYIWENQSLDGREYARKIYEWPYESRRPANARNANTLAYDDTPYLKKMMFSGCSINAETGRLPEEERKIMESNGVAAVLTMPIYQDDCLWGFIGMDSIAADLVFQDVDEKVMRSCGFLMASAIVRNRMTKNLMDAQNELMIQSRLLRAVNEVATLLLGQESAEDRFQLLCSCLRILGESMDASSVSLWRSSEKKDGMHVSCFLNWNNERQARASPRNLQLKMADYIPEWSKGVYNRSDIDLPLYRMNARLQSLSLLHPAESVLLMPVDIKGDFWGFLAFVYPEENRRLSSEERSILRAGNLNIVSAIIRGEIKEDLTVAEMEATYDSLTKIENRRSFYSRAEKMFEEHRQKRTPLTILFFDIDHFKKVNDNYGHAFGDEVLIEFAALLGNTLRPCDILCRYGGEEFVALLPKTCGEGGLAVCRRIMQKVSQMEFESNPGFSFTTSIGLADGVPQFGDTLDTYIGLADKALYRAKEEGRNRVVTN